MGKLDGNKMTGCVTEPHRELIMDLDTNSDLNQEVGVLQKNSTTAVQDGSPNNKKETGGLGTDIIIQRATKQWKRRARVVGLKHIATNEASPTVEEKRKYNSFDDKVSSNDHTSMLHKRAKTDNEDASSTILSAGLHSRLWKNFMGFSGSFMVDCRGRSGGLALLWKESVEVFLKLYSKGHINSVIKEAGNVLRFTGLYGQPNSTLRHFSWELLRRLKGLNDLRDLPWLVGGDFNEICYYTEKLGGKKRPPSQMQAFRDTLGYVRFRKYTAMETHLHGLIDKVQIE